MSRRNLIVLIVAIAVAMLCAARNEPNPFARQTSRGYRLIDELALMQPSDEDLFSGAMHGMVEVLRRHGDEHSAYIEPREADPLLAEMRQEFGGIGVRIQHLGEPPLLTIVEPPEPGTPAFHSEIQKGDVVVAVDSQPIAGLSLTAVLSKMRGAPGEPILLSILHEDANEPIDVRLIREVIHVPSIIGDSRRPDGSWEFLLPDHPQIALVRIATFGNRTAAELVETLDQLKQQKVLGIVLDVRNNAGGALDAAVGVSELFLSTGQTVLSTRGRSGEVLDVYQAGADGPYSNLSITVLIDRNTASASEIVAAALQDHGVATIIGERSFGKGTVQQLLPVNSGHSLLKLTSASYWRPSGVNIHRMPGAPEDEPWGVSPDEGFAIEQTEDELVAWFEWRRSRDMLAEPSNQEPAPRKSPLDHDPALALAVEHLLDK